MMMSYTVYQPYTAVYGYSQRLPPTRKTSYNYKEVHQPSTTARQARMHRATAIVSEFLIKSSMVQPCGNRCA